MHVHGLGIAVIPMCYKRRGRITLHVLFERPGRKCSVCYRKLPRQIIVFQPAAGQYNKLRFHLLQAGDCFVKTVLTFARL